VSQENVEVVRRGIEAWNSHDAQLWLTYAAPDVEWIPAGPAAVEKARYYGHKEVASGLTSVWQTWDEFHFEESEVRDLGDSVLWLGRLKMRGAASHLALDQEFALRSVLREGRFVTVRAFPTWNDALEAEGEA
jgi:ketosteroid isomerase-like protein